MSFFKTPFQIGALTLPHRLIQGPLAGYTCAPFRNLFNCFLAPAYCVSEMCSAADVLYKHKTASRYLYRHPAEKHLAYQLSGTDAKTLAQAAGFLQDFGADLIDINCGCPKPKIRKKGAGSALLENPSLLIEMIQGVRASISIPLTVKIRIQGNDNDCLIAQAIESAGADALIVHGRRWMDDYDRACDLKQIALIKKSVNFPVIANGDIKDLETLKHTQEITGCDAYMISRHGSGRPWLYQELLNNQAMNIPIEDKYCLFMQHLSGLEALETEFKAVLQSKSLVRYYFGKIFSESALRTFYGLTSLLEIHDFLGLFFQSQPKV